MSKLYFLLLPVCLLLTDAFAANNIPPTPMTAVDLLEIKKISQNQLSADGKNAVYLKSNLNWKRNRWLNQLWLHQVDKGVSRQLTFGYNSISNPVLSPDGRQVAFLTQRGKDKHKQIYLIHLDGGEAFKVATLRHKPGNLAWSEDGRFLYFTARPPESPEEKKLQKNMAKITAFENPEFKKVLWRIKLNSGKVEQLTNTASSVIYYHLIPNSQNVLLSKAPGHILDQRHLAELWMLNLSDLSEVQLTNNRFYEKNASISSDGNILAYSATVNQNGEQYYNNNLFITDLKTKRTKLLTNSFDGEVEKLAWAADNGLIYFTANIGLSTHLHKVGVNGGEIKQLTQGDWTIDEWSYQVNADKHLIEKRDAKEPGDLWLKDSKTFALKRLTDQYESIEQRYLLPKQEKINWLSHDEYPLEGLLTYPLSYDGSKPFPLVVQTHGGPRSSDQFGIWSYTDSLPVLAANGYGVLMVNHRGGTGYGDEFLRDMVGRYFRNAHLDVMSGVDHLVNQGLADPNRLVKMGWSAGGHMTNKLITFTDKFKAASSGAGSVDWVSMYGETDAAYMRTWWFGGKPWQKDAPIQAFNSDSVTSKLWKVKTPTLIFVGEKDDRVPATQSKILFRGLRDLGVDTELYIAPGEPHGFKKPKHRLFKINKELEWFERHVHNRKYQHEKVPQ